MTEEAYDQYSDGKAQTKWDLIVEFAVAYRYVILILFIVIFGAIMLTDVSIPSLGFAGWFLVASLIGGLTIGSSAVMYELSDYLSDRRVRVMLAPVNEGIADIVKIPRKTFGSYDIVGTSFPDRRTLTGGKALIARAIDFDKGIIVPATEFDDDKYPDDIDIIGEDGDGSQVQKYRNALLEDAHERHEITVDQEVIREGAMRDAVDMYSKALRDVRDGDIEVEHLNDEQTEVAAEQMIQQAAQSSPGDDDE